MHTCTLKKVTACVVYQITVFSPEQGCLSGSPNCLGELGYSMQYRYQELLSRWCYNKIMFIQEFFMNFRRELVISMNNHAWGHPQVATLCIDIFDKAVKSEQLLCNTIIYNQMLTVCKHAIIMIKWPCLQVQTTHVQCKM